MLYSTYTCTAGQKKGGRHWYQIKCHDFECDRRYFLGHFKGPGSLNYKKPFTRYKKVSTRLSLAVQSMYLYVPCRLRICTHRMRIETKILNVWYNNFCCGYTDAAEAGGIYVHTQYLFNTCQIQFSALRLTCTVNPALVKQNNITTM